MKAITTETSEVFTCDSCFDDRDVRPAIAYRPTDGTRTVNGVQPDDRSLHGHMDIGGDITVPNAALNPRPNPNPIPALRPILYGLDDRSFMGAIL